MITKKAIGAAIRDARTAAGLTQVELAERIGTRQSLITRWESGMHMPTAEYLHAISLAVGADPGMILTSAAAMQDAQKDA